MAKVGTSTELIEYLKTQKKEKKFKLIIYRKKRSLNQNNYFHLIIWYICDMIGEDPEILKEYYKGQFLQEETENGFTYVMRTRDLKTKPFALFTEKVRNHARDFLWVVTPDPEDKKLIDYYNDLFEKGAIK